LEVMRQASEVIDVAIFGDKLHVLVRTGAAVDGLQSRLIEAKIEAQAPVAIRASLEDVFVRLVSHAAHQAVPS